MPAAGSRERLVIGTRPGLPAQQPVVNETNSRSTVCVVIPCYNQGPYLRQSVDAALAQDHPAVEVVVVDDGSDDPQTREILEQIEPQVHRLIRTPNRGPSLARNAGIEASTGAYVLPLDADDLIGPGYAAQAARVLDESPDVGIVYCHAEYFGQRGGEWKLADYRFPDILLDNCIFTSMVFRRADWEAVGGYNVNMEGGWEDYDFVLSLIEREVRVVRLPQTHFYYRIGGSSRDSSMDAERQVRAYTQLYRNHERLYRDNIGVLFREIHELRHLRSELKHLQRRVPAREREARLAHDAHERITRDAREHNARLSAEVAALNARVQRIEASAPVRVARMARSALRRLLGDGRSAAVEPSPPASVYASYDSWFRARNGGGSVLGNDREPLAQGPLVSVVILPGPEPESAEAVALTVDSIVTQGYAQWELVTVWRARETPAAAGASDSRRHCLVDPDTPWGALLARAVASCRGSYVSFVEAGDRLHPEALDELVRFAQLHDADLLYADEDEIDESGRHVRPWFKPDFNAEHLLASNVLGRFVMAAVELLRTALGGGAAGRDAAWYDLALKLSEQARFIVHAQRVLYHRAMSKPVQRATVQEDVLAVVGAALERRGVRATVEAVEGARCQRVRRQLPATSPVSVVVALDGDGAPERARRLVSHTDYLALEWVLVGEAALLEEAAAGLDEAAIVREPVEAATPPCERLQRGAGRAGGEFLVFCGQHVTPLTRDWIAGLLVHAWPIGAGAVGGRLCDASERTLEAGIAVCQGGGIAFPHRGSPRCSGGYRDRALATQHVSAVSAGLMMMLHQLFDDVGGFDTRHYPRHWYDVDLCLRLIEAGKVNVYTPWVEARVEDPAGMVPAASDPPAPWQVWFDARHADAGLAGDPYYRTEARRLIGAGELV